MSKRAPTIKIIVGAFKEGRQWAKDYTLYESKNFYHIYIFKGGIFMMSFNRNPLSLTNKLHLAIRFTLL
jgi:hypothetical protein